MRQKADKLEKGKWYADVEYNGHMVSFLKFSHSDDRTDFSSELKGHESYKAMSDGLYHFDKEHDNFIPTQEDREKYNLIDDE